MLNMSLVRHSVTAWCGWLGRWCVRWLLTAGPIVR